MLELFTVGISTPSTEILRSRHEYGHCVFSRGESRGPLSEEMRDVVERSFCLRINVTDSSARRQYRTIVNLRGNENSLWWLVEFRDMVIRK